MLPSWWPPVGWSRYVGNCGLGGLAPSAPWSTSLRWGSRLVALWMMAAGGRQRPHCALRSLHPNDPRALNVPDQPFLPSPLGLGPGQQPCLAGHLQPQPFKHQPSCPLLQFSPGDRRLLSPAAPCFPLCHPQRCRGPLLLHNLLVAVLLVAVVARMLGVQPLVRAPLPRPCSPRLWRHSWRIWWPRCAPSRRKFAAYVGRMWNSVGSWTWPVVCSNTSPMPFPPPCCPCRRHLQHLPLNAKPQVAGLAWRASCPRSPRLALLCLMLAVRW